MQKREQSEHQTNSCRLSFQAEVERLAGRGGLHAVPPIYGSVTNDAGNWCMSFVLALFYHPMADLPCRQQAMAPSCAWLRSASFSTSPPLPLPSSSFLFPLPSSLFPLSLSQYLPLSLSLPPSLSLHVKVAIAYHLNPVEAGCLQYLTRAIDIHIH